MCAVMQVTEYRMHCALDVIWSEVKSVENPEFRFRVTSNFSLSRCELVGIMRFEPASPSVITESSMLWLTSCRTKIFIRTGHWVVTNVAYTIIFCVKIANISCWWITNSRKSPDHFGTPKVRARHMFSRFS